MATDTKHLIQDQIDQFLKKIDNAGKQLSSFSTSIDEHELKIKQSLQHFYSMIRDLQESDATTHELKQLVNDMVKNYKSKVSQWMAMIDRHIEGKEFINQFEKSILLVVFGNVNSGKSSLGNFVAGVPFENSPISYGERPPFFVYDWSDRQREKGAVPLEEGQFKENDTEETSTIQYYTLQNGLTWVDTPGIHSLSLENEELAKKYVDYADLVLFIVSSSSPGKADEIEELKKLMEKEKPILVMITKSDKTIKDYIDDEIVTLTMPKDDATRKQQETYVDQEISKKGIHEFLKDRRYVSISVKLAKKAIHEMDEVLFAQSNAPKLYEQIGNVINAHALEMKTERPKKEINSTIRELIRGFDSQAGHIEGIWEMKYSFQQILEQSNKRKIQMENVKDTIFEELRLRTIGMIETKVMKASFDFDSGQAVNASKLSEEIEREILKDFNSLLKKNISRLLSDFEFQQARSLHLKLEANFEGKYDRIEYLDYEIVEQKRDPKGILEHLQHWIFNKEFTEESIKKSHKIKNVRVGNNASEVVDQMINQTFNQLRPVVNETISRITASYFNQHEKVIESILHGLDELEGRLEQLKY